MSQVVRTKGRPPAPPGELDEPRPPEAPAYVAGEIIADKYRLIRRLGEGGMGAVWVARNLALDVQVALKLIRTDVDTEGADERLLTEARATARLKHPNIVRVFDFGRTRRNDPFIVMELLQGETLGDVLDREGRLSATYAVQLLLPCADALSAAHGKSIVHRDLKPDNVFLADSDGRLQPKVVDFGIAMFEREHRDHKLTQAGTVLGSPDYMSPEQARGLDDIDQRADIWAFCVVLYECITGRVPFEDANYNALLRHIIEDEIPSTLDYAAGDSELWRILSRGFAKDRSQRFQSMRELGEDLAGWLVMHGVTEDVSGHSLRAAWLDPTGSKPDGYLRQSFPSGSWVPRTNRPSQPDPERTTLPPAARVTQPPLELPVEVVPARGRWRKPLFGAVALITLAALGALAAGIWRRTAPEQPVALDIAAPAEPAAEAPPASASAVPTAAEPAASETAREPETPPEPSASSAEVLDEPPQKKQSAKPSWRQAPGSAARSSSSPGTSTPTSPPKPAQPYEDLGF